MVGLKNELNGHDAALLYNFWPSAKRAKMPFSIMLPGQVGTVMCLWHGAARGHRVSLLVFPRVKANGCETRACALWVCVAGVSCFWRDVSCMFSVSVLFLALR